MIFRTMRGIPITLLCSVSLYRVCSGIIINIFGGIGDLVFINYISIGALFQELSCIHIVYIHCVYNRLFPIKYF